MMGGRTPVVRFHVLMRRALVLPAVLLLVLLLGVGRAQSTFETKQSFVAGLIRFMEALPGTFGDEGPRLLASIEAMRTGLERWDAALRAYEIAETLELQHARAAEAAAAR